VCYYVCTWVCNYMCHRESFGVCGEVCEQPLWRKERGNSQLLPIANCVGFFEDPTVKPCLIELQFLLIVYWRCDCLLEVCRSVRNFVKSCCPQQVPFTVSLGFFRNPTVKSSPIALKFWWSFITHISLFWMVRFEIGAVVCSRKFVNVVYFSGDEIVELFLINFNLLVFLGQCWWPFWRLGRFVLICFVINFVRLIVSLFFVLKEYLPSYGFFDLYWKVFPTLIIGVDLFFYFWLHIGFVWIDWLRSGYFHIIMIKVNLFASAAWLPSILWMNIYESFTIRELQSKKGKGVFH